MDKKIPKILKERNLPKLMAKDEMLDILLKNEYGYIPSKPEQITFTKQANCINNFCASKAVADKITAMCIISGKEFEFSFYSAIPTKEGKHPFFIHINFRDCVPDLYMPTEELIDNGFAVFSFCYNDITKDNPDFNDGLAGVLYDGKPRGKSDPGKIAMWAWAAQRVMDYAYTLPDLLDFNRSVVCGHSRLGKTALLTAATDERFAFAYSNNSGCSGAALARGNKGETIKDICDVRFPYWFCENYSEYIDNEEAMPFDQHYLIASIAPRFVCVGSAKEDLWADPDSEMLACAAASEAFENQGLAGFMGKDRLPEADDIFFDGCIGYHMRKGTHFFSREDWLRLIKFVNIHS